ncbi:hypothetical protein Tco_0654713 [Tanacetum coccineum]|uniref:Uncharacterized protein n=1 Tax=Tanacetum coccineum TaxID=301880 RepID=A0ABQ4X404_9ASTR
MSQLTSCYRLPPAQTSGHVEVSNLRGDKTEYLGKDFWEKTVPHGPIGLMTLYGHSVPLIRHLYVGMDIAKIAKRTVKTGQTRTRERKDCTRADNLIARKVKSHLQSTLGQPKSTH